MIEVRDLAKAFGPVRALAGVDFTAREGRVTGLLGPNGAGKSTCLRILSTVIAPDAGSATIGGLDVVAQSLEVRRICGVLPHGSGLYPQLSARENIAYYARLHGLRGDALERRVDALVERLHLADIAARRAKGFSQGERTKVALARALVHAPKYLLLDEPSSGLDVMATRDLRAWLRELRDEGCCVLLSSHVMQEIAALADDIVIIAHGHIAAAGTPAALAQEFDNDDLEQIFVDAVGRIEARAPGREAPAGSSAGARRESTSGPDRRAGS
jgi:sodium transport system ATP-binding protein